MASKARLYDVWQQCGETLTVGVATYYCTQDSRHDGRHTLIHPDDSDELAAFNALPRDVRCHWAIED